MKLANVAVNGGVRAASVKDDRLLLLDYDNLASVLAQGTPPDQLPVASDMPLDSVRLLPPSARTASASASGSTTHRTLRNPAWRPRRIRCSSPSSRRR